MILVCPLDSAAAMDRDETGWEEEDEEEVH
jgi:hypothetical protein